MSLFRFFRGDRKLRKELQALQEKNEELAGRIDTITEANLHQSGKIAGLEKLIRKQKELVREQTKADLLLNALKAVGMVKDNAPKDYFAEARRLRELQAAQMQGSGRAYAWW